MSRLMWKPNSAAGSCEESEELAPSESTRAERAWGIVPLLRFNFAMWVWLSNLPSHRKASLMRHVEAEVFPSWKKAADICVRAIRPRGFLFLCPRPR